MGRERGRGEMVSFMVLDFVDAFWEMPLAPNEQGYCTGKLGPRITLCGLLENGSRQSFRTADVGTYDRTAGTIHTSHVLAGPGETACVCR